MVTKKILSDKLLSYLQHHISLKELVAWSEQVLFDQNFEDEEDHTIRDILALLGMADVKAFGLEWKDCESMMKKLGFKLEVNALKVA